MRHVLLFLLTAACLAVAAEDFSAPRYASDGALTLPADYRDWVFLSAGLGMTYGPAASANTAEHPSFENVFVNREAHQSFLKTGQWPDKTMFILEIRSSESKGSINQGGHYQSGIAAIEAEVKDGGKWTFYGFGRSGTSAKALARKESCYTCHAQNGAVDNTFVQFYPTLLPVARSKGTVSARFASNQTEK